MLSRSCWTSSYFGGRLAFIGKRLLPPIVAALVAACSSFDPYRLVEYTSEQAGLPAARHWRHFDERDGELAYRIVVEYEPRRGWRGLADRSVVRRATERAVHETLANLHERFQGSGPSGARS